MTGEDAARLAAQSIPEPTHPNVPRANGHGDRPTNVTPIRGGNHPNNDDQGDNMPEDHGDQAPDEEQQGPNPAEQRKVKKYEVRSDTGEDAPLEFSTQSRKDMAGVLRMQRIAAIDKRRLQQPLSPVEERLAQMTPERLTAIEQGNISREDLALVWLPLTQEIKLLNRQLGENSVDKVSTQRTGLLKLKKRVNLTTEQVPDPNRQVDQADLKSTGSKKELQAKVKRLNNLRHDVSKAFFGVDVSSSLLEHRLDSGSPVSSISNADVQQPSSNRFEQIATIQLGEVLAQKYGGREWSTLNPSESLEAEREARERAVTIVLEDEFKQMLLGRKPGVTKEALQTRRDAAVGEPDQELVGRTSHELQQAKDNLATAEREEQTIKGKINDLNAIRRAPEKAQDKVTIAENSLNTANTRLNGAVTSLNELRQRRRELEDELIPERRATNWVDSASSHNAQTQEKIQHQDELIQTQQTLISSLQRTVDEQTTTLQQRQEDLAEAQREAEDKFDQDLLNDLTTDRNRARALIRTRKHEVETLEDRLRGLEGSTAKEREKIRSAYELWIKLTNANGYGKVIESRYSHESDERYSREVLGSTTMVTDVNGTSQLQGAEAIRANIFQIVDPGHYDPELARRMIPDQIIEQAVIHTFNLSEENVVDLTQPIARNALQYVSHATQYQIADMLRVIIRQGLQSAESGKPFLNPNDFQKPSPPEPPQQPAPRQSGPTASGQATNQTNTPDTGLPRTSPPSPERRNLSVPKRIGRKMFEVDPLWHEEYPAKFTPEVADLLEEGLGKAQVDQNHFTLEQQSMYGSAVRTNFNFRDGELTMSAILDESFYNALPEDLNHYYSRLDSTVQRHFYDGEGKKLPKENLPPDALTGNPSESISEHFIDNVDSLSYRTHNLSEKLSHNIGENHIFPAIANAVFTLPANERKELLGNMDDIFVYDVNHSNYKIDYDTYNDRFSILKLAPRERNKPVELSKFLADLTKKFHNQNGTLEPDEHDYLRREMLEIQKAIGKQIIRKLIEQNKQP